MSDEGMDLSPQPSYSSITDRGGNKQLCSVSCLPGTPPLTAHHEPCNKPAKQKEKVDLHRLRNPAVSLQTSKAGFLPLLITALELCPHLRCVILPLPSFPALLHLDDQNHMSFSRPEKQLDVYPTSSHPTCISHIIYPKQNRFPRPKPAPTSFFPASVNSTFQ